MYLTLHTGSVQIVQKCMEFHFQNVKTKGKNVTLWLSIKLLHNLRDKIMALLATATNAICFLI